MPVQGIVSGVQSGVSDTAGAVNAVVQAKSFCSLFMRDEDELTRDSYDIFIKLEQEYIDALRKNKHSLEDDDSPRYLTHKVMSEPAGFYRKKPRLRFAEVFEINQEFIMRCQDSSSGNRLIMGTVEKIRHIPTLGKQKQNLHKIICGQIISELREYEKLDAATKQVKYKQLIRFIANVLQGGLYLIADSDADAEMGSKLTAIKHSIDQEINDLEIERFKVLISNGAIELKKQANLLIVNTMTVLSILLEYGRFEFPVVGLEDLSQGVIGTVRTGFIRKQSVAVSFSPSNPCQEILKKIAILFSTSNLAKFDEMIKKENIPSIEILKRYIETSIPATILLEMKAGGMLGKSFNMGVNSLACQVRGLLSHLHFLAHGLRVFTHLAAVASHQVGDLLRNPAGLELIETIMNNYVLKLGEMSRDANNLLRPLEDMFHSKGVAISSKIGMLINGLGNLRDAPANAVVEQAKLTEAFKFRAMIMEELAADKRNLFDSIESMNKTFFDIGIAEQVEGHRQYVLDDIKEKLMAYAKDSRHRYKFALHNLDSELSIPIQGRQLVVVDLDSRFVSAAAMQAHESRALFIYQLLAIVDDQDLSENRLKYLKIALDTSSSVQDPSFANKDFKVLIGQLRQCLENYILEETSQAFGTKKSYYAPASTSHSANQACDLSLVPVNDRTVGFTGYRMHAQAPMQLHHGLNGNAQGGLVAAVFISDGRQTAYMPLHTGKIAGSQGLASVRRSFEELLPIEELQDGELAHAGAVSKGRGVLGVRGSGASMLN